jgi:(p)ppGpp synthase/HD superfamily hydrolase
MEHIIEKALQLALEVHGEQVDKEGRPFILHILNVALQGTNDLEIVVGLLHDVVEDSFGFVTCEDLMLEYKFPEDVMDAVYALTRQEGEVYKDYIHRLVKNPLAARVKVYDLLHNLNPSRGNFAGAKSLRERHLWAFEYVLRHLQKIGDIDK